MKTIITPRRWAAALDRAISNALDVLVSTGGEVFVESASVPGLLYAVSREGCSCSAGQAGQPCQHRACYLAQCGELPLDPEPGRVTFTGNSDRQEVHVDGEVYGNAVATEYGGWELFRGRFPHAQRIGSYCSLHEIERDLTAQLPVTLHIPTAAPVADLVAA